MQRESFLGKSLTELRSAILEGDVTSVELVDAYLDRIEARNDDLCAVIAINPNARADAAALDASADRGPLHGLPILIKDNIETRELPTTAGSLALADNLTHRDAHLVASLREAGAVILGKANLSEWAFFRSSRGVSGWSAVGGQVRNPWDPLRSACGSSSGSGAAVAADMAPAAIGTETNGSVTCPASITGIVGLKPTVGLISQTGIVPISHSQDTAGPMTKTVADAALLMAAMATHEEFQKGLGRADLEGLRLGVLTPASNFHPTLVDEFVRAIGTLEGLGARVVPDLKLEVPDGFTEASRTVLHYEFKHGINAYLASLPNEHGAQTLEDLIDFNNRHADLEMPFFRQESFERAQDMGSLADREYLDALAFVQSAARENGIDAVLERDELDALIGPTRGPAWVIDAVNGDPRTGGGNGVFSAVSGYPHLTVPMGRVHGLPVGISFMGAAHSDAKLLEIGDVFERASGRLSPAG